MPDMLTSVISILTDNAGLPPGPVTPDATLVDAGVDSMAIAVLAMILEEDHGVVVTETDLSGVRTITDLATFIEHHRTANA